VAAGTLTDVKRALGLDYFARLARPRG